MMDDENNENQNDEQVKQTPENNNEPIEQKQEKETTEPIQEEMKSSNVEPPVQPTNITANTQNNVASSSKFEPIQQNTTTKTKKKGKKGIFAILILLIILVAALCGYYYFKVYTNPQSTYRALVKEAINSLTETTSKEDASTVKAKMKLDLNIELEDEMQEYFEEYFGKVFTDVLGLVNDTELSVDLQMDMEKQQVLYKLDSTYEDEDLLKANMLIDAKEEKTYMELEQFFDDVFEVDLEGNEVYDSLKSAFETESLTLGQEISVAKIKKILINELSKVIKEEYCSKENDKIEIDSKEVNVNKYILKMTGKQFIDEIETVVKNLKDNKEFIECFKDQSEAKEQLDSILDMIKNLDVDEDAEFSIIIYKKGIKQETVRFDIIVKADGEEVAVEVEKASDSYNFRILENGNTIINGTIKAEKENDTEKLNLMLDIKQVGKIEINTEATLTLGGEIENLDTEGARNIDDIAEEEARNAMEKLQDSKLYELVEKFSSSIESNIQSSLDNPDSNEVTSKTKENQIETYSGGTIIEFDIPSGYKSDYLLDTYKTFTKGSGDNTIAATVSSYSGDKESYLSTLNESKVMYEDDEDYSNVNLTEEKTMTVDGNTFYYVELSYEYSNLKYYETYIYTPINIKDLYTVSIVSSQSISQLNIEDFLKIEEK